MNNYFVLFIYCNDRRIVMKKIIPFKKQVYFENHVQEITSISLEHTLTPNKNNFIKGEFIISGEYRIADTSTNTDPFEFYIPCDIEVHERYKTDKVQINIDDFYYEIIDSNVLEVNIDVLLDKLEEEEVVINEIPMNYVTVEEFDKDMEEEVLERVDCEDVLNKYDEEVEIKMEDNHTKDEERCIEDETYTNSIFNSFNDSEDEYRTYKVYIVREGDSLEQILLKYQINKDELEKYNDLKDINVGDKIIIPYLYENN